MQSNGFNEPLRALRRKLRALAAIAADSGATAPERANAESLKKRLEDRLRAAEVRASAGDWTDHAFRLGRWAKDLRQSVSPEGGAAAGKADWADNARRLGKAFRRGYRKWFSE
jgi:hypothetical protein